MRPIRRGTGIALGMAVVLALSLIGAAPAAAAPRATAEATWKLEDFNQKVCLRTDRGWPDTYVVAPISGEWSTPITTGVTVAPPVSASSGGKVWPTERSEFIGFVGVSFGPAAEGDYTAEVWATDGTVTQTAPVLLRYTESGRNCW